VAVTVIILAVDGCYLY